MSTDDSDNENLLAIKCAKAHKRSANSNKDTRCKRVRIYGSSATSLPSSSKELESSGSEVDGKKPMTKVTRPKKNKNKRSAVTRKNRKELVENLDEELLVKNKRQIERKEELEKFMNEFSDTIENSRSPVSIRNVNNLDEDETHEKIEEKVESSHSESGSDKGDDIKVEAEIQSSSSDSEGTLGLLRADKGNFAGQKVKNTKRRSPDLTEKLPALSEKMQNLDDTAVCKSGTLDGDFRKLEGTSKEELDSTAEHLQDDLLKSTEKSTLSSKSSCKTEEESHRFKRLRRLAAVAGLRFKYKQLEGIRSESKKYRILKDFMIQHGITKFTLKDCKEFRVRKEEEAEVAELSNNQIIGGDSTRRVTRGSRRLEESKKASRKAHLSTSSSDNASEREEMIEENRQIFSRLKGIVSDESD